MAASQEGSAHPSSQKRQAAVQQLAGELDGGLHVPASLFPAPAPILLAPYPPQQPRKCPRLHMHHIISGDTTRWLDCYNNDTWQEQYVYIFKMRLAANLI